MKEGVEIFMVYMKIGVLRNSFWNTIEYFSIAGSQADFWIGY